MEGVRLLLLGMVDSKLVCLRGAKVVYQDIVDATLPKQIMLKYAHMFRDCGDVALLS